MLLTCEWDGDTEILRMWLPSPTASSLTAQPATPVKYTT